MFEESYTEDGGEEEVEDSDHDDESETAESRDELEQRLYRYRRFITGNLNHHLSMCV